MCNNIIYVYYTQTTHTLCMYGLIIYNNRVWIKRISKVTNPACGQLIRKTIFPLSVPICSRLRNKSRETGSVDPSRLSLLVLQSSCGPNLVLTRGNTPTFHGGVHSFIPSTAIGSVPSLSGHANAYRCRSLPRGRRCRASIVLKVVPVTNGCCLFRISNGSFFLFSSLFPYPLLKQWIG